MTYQKENNDLIITGEGNMEIDEDMILVVEELPFESFNQLYIPPQSEIILHESSWSKDEENVLLLAIVMPKRQFETFTMENAGVIQ